MHTFVVTIKCSPICAEISGALKAFSTYYHLKYTHSEKYDKHFSQ